MEWIHSFIVELHRKKLNAKEQLWGALFILLIYNAMKGFKDQDLKKEAIMLLFGMIGSSSLTCLNELTTITANDVTK